MLDAKASYHETAKSCNHGGFLAGIRVGIYPST